MTPELDGVEGGRSPILTFPPVERRGKGSPRYASVPYRSLDSQTGRCNTWRTLNDDLLAWESVAFTQVNHGRAV